MFQVVTYDRVLMYEKQEQEKEYISKMKHTAGDFNRWITRFEDQIETCETIGVELSDDAKILYFTNNLNDTIFGDVKANLMDLSTRALFPHKYEEIKQRMIAEYSQISTRKPLTVFKVIRGEDSKRHGEANFKAEEEGCHICGNPGISTGVAVTSIKNILLTKTGATTRRSIASARDPKRRPLKVGQHLEARLLDEEGLEAEDQGPGITRGQMPTLLAHQLPEPQKEPNKQE